jgi:hypothetical protein
MTPCDTAAAVPPTTEEREFRRLLAESGADVDQLRAAAEMIGWRDPLRRNALLIVIELIVQARR